MPRRDNPPELSYEERITGTGTLIREDIVVPVVRFVLTRNRYDVESEWEFRAFSDGDVWDPRWHSLLAPGRRVLRFDGADDYGKPVSVAALRFRRRSGREFEGAAQIVSTGTPRIEASPDYQHIRIELWPTSLAEPEVLYPVLHWTGEIKAIRAKRREDAPEVSKVWVDVAGHRLRFSKHFVWDDATVGGQESTVRVPISTLSGRVHARKRSGSVESLCDALESELEDLTRLLTLLSRRHIRWSRIKVETRWKEGEGGDYDTYTRIRGSHSSHRVRESVPLVLPGRMPKDWLQQLLTNYRNLESKESVAAAIIYLVAARDSTFVDAAIANAYTAFEASLNALSARSSAFTLPTAAFDKLASTVRKVVREFATSRNLPADTLDEIIRKVPELRRRPIVERAIEYITSNAIDTSGIWPEEISLADGLGAMIRRRNQFIHTGKLGEIHQVSIDAQRLMILTERMLLQALGVKDDWINPRSHDSYVATVPEPVDE
jgi:hypothetical protein